MRTERFHADLVPETPVRHVHFCVFDRFKCRVLLLGGSLVLIPNGFHLLVKLNVSENYAIRRRRALSHEISQYVATVVHGCTALYV